MDRPLKFWEFLVGLLAMAVTFGTIIYNCGTINARTDYRLTTVEAKVTDAEKDIKELRSDYQKTVNDVNNNLFDIKLLLQTKQDKKK